MSGTVPITPLFGSNLSTGFQFHNVSSYVDSPQVSTMPSSIFNMPESVPISSPVYVAVSCPIVQVPLPQYTERGK